MQRISVVVISIILLCCFSMHATAKEESPPSDTTEIQIENTTSLDVQNNYYAIGESLLKSSSTYVSIGGIVLFGAYSIFFKKDLPKWKSAIISFSLLLLILIARLCLFSSYADLLITIFVFVLFSSAYIIFSYSIEYKKQDNEDSKAIETNIDKQACNIINRVIKKCHSSIKCIQLYSFEEKESDTDTIFNINLSGGSAKPSTNINALFAHTIKLPKEFLKNVKAIQNFYIKLTSDDDFSEEEQNVILILIEQEINTFRNQLNLIPSIDEITEQDCYIARILLVYLSIYAAITEHDSYIGLGRDSLGLNNQSVESYLLTHERTGILASILFQNMPYVFSYLRGNNKQGRFYYSFSCGKKKKYIVMITLTNKNNIPYIDFAIANSLNSIQKKLVKTLEPHEKKEATNNE